MCVRVLRIIIYMYIYIYAVYIYMFLYYLAARTTLWLDYTAIQGLETKLFGVWKTGLGRKSLGPAMLET